MRNAKTEGAFDGVEILDQHQGWEESTRFGIFLLFTDFL